MSSAFSVTAQGSNIPEHRPAASSADPSHPPTPLPSHDGHARSTDASATSAALTASPVNIPRRSLTTVDSPIRPSRSIASSGDVGTDISQRLSSTPTQTPAKKERAKPARKDTTSAVSKDAIKEPRNSRDSIKDFKDQRNATNGRTTSFAHPSASVDPLSHHIFTRTNTERSIASRLLNSAHPDSPSNDSIQRPGPDIANKLSSSQPDSAKDKKKGVSFLSRLSMIGGKKKDDDVLDNESELSEQRTEGANALAFSSAVYIPHHKEPPRYIRVHAQYKKDREFNRIFLAQELAGTGLSSSAGQGEPLNEKPSSAARTKGDSTLSGPIWATEFSQDGRYLATGGRDRILRVWAVIATEEDRRTYHEEENASTEHEEHLSAPVFHSKPAREFTGHEGDILDLSWSKNNFLLSSSMDKTVRLWHMSRRECLCTFKHKDFVASIAFHPRDDRFFLAGSLDSSLRLWSIPDKAVAYSSQLSDIITAVGFSPDGKTAIAGTLHGICMFYETEGLRFLSQLHVRSSRGKNAKGSKITGIQTMNFGPDDTDSEVKLLVTSNDSRIRIYNMADKSLDAKLKGHENTCNQIRASFSDDGEYVISGSEDRKAFIWSREMAGSESKEKCPHEYFQAHSEVVTTAIFAPTTTRQLLQASHDPIFTLCNPPPVTLRSKDESMVNVTPSVCDTQSEYSVKAKKPEETPAFISRSNHRDGNIIVTTDNSGLIKVFRQDCAFAKRRHDNWETNSSFSKKLGRDKLLLGRTGSIMTGTSVSSRDPHSRRGSLSQPFQINSDRINTWRQGVEGNPGRPLSIAATATTTTTPAGSVRSPSPVKRTPASPTINRVPEVRRQLRNITSPTLHPTSPTTSIRSNRISEPSRGETETSVPPAPGFSFRSADDEGEDSRLDLAGTASSFWKLNKWRNMGVRHSSMTSKHEGTLGGSFQTAADELPTPSLGGRESSLEESSSDIMAEQQQQHHQQQSHENNSSFFKDRRRSGNVSLLKPSPLEERDENDGFLAPPEQRIMLSKTRTNRTSSILSRLSSEITSAASEEGEEMECVKCGSHDFRAKRVGGAQRLLCGKCGRMVDV
ncbi:WD40-repeat-containing domain protein [Xylaria bambusicola]|uniref:WD40-repeat-containing domain protein n=1 Tax=Xylaria bambusicola TaxID=326684 RepID=UPI002007AAF3|nr:WD40-repeat-containing domain protein [Xylaria bambusicola]KAI0512814.1 WD40-repeat-containing domain protein [Xylaria bambusicola]